jgi:hypothetical protein
MIEATTLTEKRTDDSLSGQIVMVKGGSSGSGLESARWSPASRTAPRTPPTAARPAVAGGS